MHPCLRPLLLLTLSAAAAADPLDADTYNQWKQALKTTTATPAGEIRALPGFRVELVRPALAEEGSWIALAFDTKGRAIISREDRGLWRITPPAKAGDPAPAEGIDFSLAEVRGLICEGDSLIANANNSRVLVKLRDNDGDGQYEERINLMETTGGVGHGRNQIARHPDKSLWVMHGDDVAAPENIPPLLRSIPEGRMMPGEWDRFHWSNSVKPPCGHVVIVKDQQAPELFCGGLRNPFGIAINEDGEAFTYDADMEWDVGLPWYRPTRVLHLVKDADYGWRGGSRALPAWLPDTWPAVCDIGKGSPTSIMFGTRSKFPRPWRDALFIMDWAYGIIYAVHLTPKGCTYEGRSEVFLQGRPLNVTGMDFGPDGALYFVTGGRRTQSGLYRLVWTGEQAPPETKPADTAALAAAAKAREQRHALEAFLTYPGMPPDGWNEAVEAGLKSDDPWIRRAAREVLYDYTCRRRVLDRFRGDTKISPWMRRLETLPPGPALEAALVLGITALGIDKERVRSFLCSRDWAALSEDQRTVLLRALQRSLLSSGMPNAIERGRLVAYVESVIPCGQPHPDQLGAELLVYFESRKAIAKILTLQEKAVTQEERLHYLFVLRLVKTGWTLDQRKTWLAAFRREAARSVGAHHLGVTFRYCRAEFEAALTPEEKTALGSELATLDPAAVAIPQAAPRPFVKAWTQAELEPQLAGVAAPERDLKRGKELFNSQCAACHRYGPQGGVIGPDLTGIAGRFDRRTVLESLLDPWRVVADPYRVATATLKSGEILSGRVVGDDGTTISIEVNPVDADASRKVKRDDTTALTITSVMPPGLVNTMSAEELLDLMAYMERGQ